MFSRFFIFRPIFASVLSMLIVFVGGVSIPFLPVENLPDVVPPTIIISAIYPGANAQIVADTVAFPIEEQVNGVEDMLYMSSQSSDDGSMRLTVTFDVGTDLDVAQMLVQNRAALAEPSLPEEVVREGISVTKQSTDMMLVLSLVSTDGQNDPVYLSNYASIHIKDVLSRVDGVGSVSILGGRDFGMRIWLDPNQLASRDLTPGDVITAIREQNAQIPAGRIGMAPSPAGQKIQYTVSALGRLQEAEQFEQIVIKGSEAGELVRVMDVARVELGAENYESYAQLNGDSSVALGIFQLPGSNALQVADGVKAEMEKLSQSFPTGLEYRVMYDATLFISASIGEVIKTLLIAGMLVFLVVYIFLQDFRASLVPAVTIPVSLIGTFAVMFALGYSINTLTLFGLVLVIGIVVDDAIVVVENTMRIIDDEALSSKDAAVKSMLQVTGPVIATTLVLLAVFVPTAMLGGITGRLYRQFALTISAATIFSSINALTLSPALCGVLLRQSPGRRALPFRMFNTTFDWIRGWYSVTVGGAVRRAPIMIALFIALTGSAAYLLRSEPTAFIPNEDQGFMLVNIQLPEGASLERTTAVAERVNEMLGGIPEIRNYVMVGGYSFIDSANASNKATAFASLEPWDRRTTPAQSLRAVIGRFARQASEIQEAEILAFGLPAIRGLGVTGGFELLLQDRRDIGINALEAFAGDLLQQANATSEVVQAFTTFRADTPRLFVDINRTEAKKLGVPITEISQTLQTQLGSVYVNDFSRFGRVYSVRVQADHEFRDQPDDISLLKVRSAAGNMIPLATLVDVAETSGPQRIVRYNLYPAIMVMGQNATGHSTGKAMGRLEAIVDAFPNSVGYEWTGMSFQEKRVGGQAIYIFAAALVFVYLVLAAQYESWSMPLVVILSVPLAIVGASVSLWLTPIDNNTYAQIGLVLLIALSSKNAILIVEFAQQRHSEGATIRAAAVEAARLRYRPILMTSLSFILGVLPLVIATGAGATSRRSLGTVVFGGMVSALVLGVILVPVLYVVVQSVSERLRRTNDV